MTTKSSLTVKIRLFFLLTLETVSNFTHTPDFKFPILAGFV